VRRAVCPDGTRRRGGERESAEQERVGASRGRSCAPDGTRRDGGNGGHRAEETGASRGRACARMEHEGPVRGRPQRQGAFTLRGQDNRLVSRALSFAVVLALQARSEPTCEIDRTTYNCEPIPEGSLGCTGGPQWTRPGESLPLHQDDPDKTFPIDCYAQIPDCSGAFAGPRAFVCADHQPPAWVELR
jgi:hypothetical protein